MPRLYVGFIDKAASPGSPDRAGFARAGVGVRLARRAACVKRSKNFAGRGTESGLERSDRMQRAARGFATQECLSSV